MGSQVTDFRLSLLFFSLSLSSAAAAALPSAGVDMRRGWEDEGLALPDVCRTRGASKTVAVVVVVVTDTETK